MDAYSQAILRNPSLMSDAVVMDVGCGTGILRLVGVSFYQMPAPYRHAFICKKLALVMDINELSSIRKIHALLFALHFFCLLK